VEVEFKEYSRKKKNKKRFKTFYEENQEENVKKANSYKREKFDFRRLNNTEDE